MIRIAHAMVSFLCQAVAFLLSADLVELGCPQNREAADLRGLSSAQAALQLLLRLGVVKPLNRELPFAI